MEQERWAFNGSSEKIRNILVQTESFLLHSHLNAWYAQSPHLALFFVMGQPFLEFMPRPRVGCKLYWSFFVSIWTWYVISQIHPTFGSRTSLGKRVCTVSLNLNQGALVICPCPPLNTQPRASRTLRGCRTPLIKHLTSGKYVSRVSTAFYPTFISSEASKQCTSSSCLYARPLRMVWTLLFIA